MLVLGKDISHLSREMQFAVCAVGVFGFSLLYGYLQELISVQICNRKLGLYLATVQFSGYTGLSFILRKYVYKAKPKKRYKSLIDLKEFNENDDRSHHTVPIHYYIGISAVRAVDLAMTNLAMQYINYPAKTLMKSSRIVFTMIFGVFIGKKSYSIMDYIVVGCMVIGLSIFMHADANSSAIFDPIGVIMLTISLLCDGAVSNFSEQIMKQYNVGQDEYIFRMYSISLVYITAVAIYYGDFAAGIIWMLQPGTYNEVYLPSENETIDQVTTWSAPGKIIVLILFSSMGFFGSSFSAAITKNFGALTMSITSTARKATTLFLSFFLFNNVCTAEHIAGIAIFISALTTKSLRNKSKGNKNRKGYHKSKQKNTAQTINEFLNMNRNESPSVRLSSLLRRNSSISDGSTHNSLTTNITMQNNEDYIGAKPLAVVMAHDISSPNKDKKIRSRSRSKDTNPSDATTLRNFHNKNPPSRRAVQTKLVNMIV